MTCGGHASIDPFPENKKMILNQFQKGRWDSDNYEKLVTFLATTQSSNPNDSKNKVAVFDADNTLWSGDIGETTFVWMTRNLKFSPRLEEVLPELIRTDSNHTLFVKFRWKNSIEKMYKIYQTKVNQAATISDFMKDFSSELLRQRGPIAYDLDFREAYNVAVGTLLAAYPILIGQVGEVAYDSRRTHDHCEQSWFKEMGMDHCLNDMLDEQTASTKWDVLQFEGKLGGFGQLAIWQTFDKTPKQVREQTLAAWTEFQGSEQYGYEYLLDPGVHSFPLTKEETSDPSYKGLPLEMKRGSIEYGVQARPEMQNLVQTMRDTKMIPIVVSASQQDIVQAIANAYYGFEDSEVIGISITQSNGAFTNGLFPPIPFRLGKVEAIQKFLLHHFSDLGTRPIFCAGDSNTDLEFLGYSSHFQLFFDRGKKPFMDFAEKSQNEHSLRSIIQNPFELSEKQ